jgi:hypothetical protein
MLVTGIQVSKWRFERLARGSVGAWERWVRRRTRPARRPWRSGRADLDGHGAEGLRETRPRVGIRMGSREMQDDAADGSFTATRISGGGFSEQDLGELAMMAS